MFNTPILFIIFNRPDTTQRVLEKIREIKPQKLFIAADGPRIDKDGEIDKCLKAREVAAQIDWPCECKTLFNDENAGPFWGPVNAITWFFSEVEEGIILEDDCLPDLSFFTFCEKLLAYYRENERIMHISGSNFQFGKMHGSQEYYFSKYTHVWGWATWRRAWKHYFDIEKIQSFEKEDLRRILVKNSNNENESDFWIRKFTAIHNGSRKGIWDYQWNFTVWFMSGLAIVPNLNLISNIGFREDATGTTNTNNKFANLPPNNISIKSYAKMIEQNKQADYYVFHISGYYFHSTVKDRFRWRIKKIIQKSFKRWL